MTRREPHATAAELLAWYRAAGVDEAIADTPVDWLARGLVAPGAGFAMATQNPAVRPTAEPAKGDTRPRPPAAPQSSAPPTAAAMSAVGQASSLAELRAALEGFEGCALKSMAKSLCLFRGAEQARLMIIGEAPGREEDLEGLPFVGRAGKLLDRMLAAAGLDAVAHHITNIVYWRPPGNRTPTPQEALACRPFLEQQAALVAPDHLLILGGAAAKHLFATEEGIMRLRGKWRTIRLGGRDVRALATLHPAYLLRSPIAKRLAWRDLLALKASLASG